MLEIPAAALGALGRRVAGGGFQDWTGIDVGDFPARGFFGLTMSAAALMDGCSIVPAGMIAPAVFLGCSFPMTVRLGPLGTFGSIHFGSSPDTLPRWRRALGLITHALVGFSGVMGIAYGLMPHVSVLYIAAGCLAIWPFYELGWLISGPLGRQWMPQGLRWGHEYGELLWGAAMAIALFYAA